MPRLALLFADQVDSTRLLAEIGSEAMLAVRRSLDNILHSAVDDHCGRVFGDMGDGVAAVFTSPVDALGAACQMQRQADLTRHTPGPPIELRVGVHVGDVVENDGGYVGMPIHIAARLCEIAPHGCTATTPDLADELDPADLEPTIDVRAFERRLLKGIAEPIHVHLVIDSERDQAAPIPGSQPDAPALISSPWLLDSATSLVGRDAELERLRAAAQNRLDRPRLVLIEGEAGIGKTALLRSFGAELHGADTLCVVGRADEIQPAPFREFIEIVNHLARQLPDFAVTDHVLRHGTLLTQLAPALNARAAVLASNRDHHAGTDIARRQHDDGIDQFALYEAITDLLRSTSARRPLALFLEDIHWSSQPSLALLRHLARAADLADLMIVASLRSDEIEEGSALAAFLGRLSTEVDLVRLPIEPLQVQDVRSLVDGHPFAELAEQLHRQTGGNPLFVTEMMRSVDQQQAPTLTSDGVLEVPATVQELAAQRINRLGPAHRSLLADAAVLGPRFEVWHLEAITPGHIDVLSTLEEAQAAGVIDADPLDDEAYAFHHALIREALYQRISAPRRRRRHSAAADAVLATDPSTISQRAADVLRHIEESNQLRSPYLVADLARDAARNALAALDLHRAVAYHRRVVEALRRIDQPSAEEVGAQAEALIELASVETAAGLDQGRATFVEASVLARSIGRWDLAGEAACRYGGPVKENQAILDISEPEELITAALEHETGPTAMRARLLTALAIWQRQHVPHVERQRLTDGAIAIARSLDEPDTLAAVQAGVHRALHGPMFTLAAREAGAELERMAAQMGDDLTALQAYNLALQAAFELGAWEETDHRLNQLEALGDRLSTIEVRRLSLLWRATRASLRGEEQAHQLHTRELRKLLSSYPPTARTVMLGASGIVLPWLSGASGAIYPLVGEFGPDALKAILAADSGQTTVARQHIEALGGMSQVLTDQNYLFYLAVVGMTRTAARADDPVLADEVYRGLLPYSGRNARMGLVAFLGAVDHHLGSLAAVLGRHDDAIRHLTAALDRHRSMNARPWVALTQAELARLVADPAIAAQHAAEARAVATEAGWQLVLQILDSDQSERIA